MENKKVFKVRKAVGDSDVDWAALVATPIINAVMSVDGVIDLIGAQTRKDFFIDAYVSYHERGAIYVNSNHDESLNHDVEVSVALYSQHIPSSGDGSIRHKLYNRAYKSTYVRDVIKGKVEAWKGRINDALERRKELSALRDLVNEKLDVQSLSATAKWVDPVDLDVVETGLILKFDTGLTVSMKIGKQKWQVLFVTSNMKVPGSMKMFDEKMFDEVCEKNKKYLKYLEDRCNELEFEQKNN